MRREQGRLWEAGSHLRADFHPEGALVWEDFRKSDRQAAEAAANIDDRWNSVVGIHRRPVHIIRARGVVECIVVTERVDVSTGSVESLSKNVKARRDFCVFDSPFVAFRLLL